MTSSFLQNKVVFSEQKWPWWPLLPLYPYGRKRTLFNELVPNQLWSLDQLQGLYYVAVPVRLTIVKVPGGLMLFNPLPPTQELCKAIYELENKHGPVISIVLPTASGLEHKISMPALSRIFSNAELWICSGQWSFPVNLPLSWLGFSVKRTKILFKDGLPYESICKWISLGPLDIGLGSFQEIACFHKPSRSLLITDALVGIEAEPPALFDLDPTPLLFHSRERGDELLKDSLYARKKGWARLVLFASFLRPLKLDIPPLFKVLRNSFQQGLVSPKFHFGLYPFEWQEGWELSAKDLIGEKKPLVQVAPVLERLVFPRAKRIFIEWLDEIIKLDQIRYLVPAHYSAPIDFSPKIIRRLKEKIQNREWAVGKGDWKFLDSIDKNLLKFGIVPKDPLKAFKD